MIEEKVIRAPVRKLTANWTVESREIVDQKVFGFVIRKFQWKFLLPWNWKKLFEAYKTYRKEKELANVLAEEIRKECDKDFLNMMIKMKEELDKNSVHLNDVNYELTEEEFKNKVKILRKR